MLGELLPVMIAERDAKKNREHKRVNQLTHIGTAVTFDDVQLVPRYSEVESRAKTITEVQFTRNFRIDKPIIAAPMDSVCDANMAIALWDLGCVGVIHRFMSIEEQAAHVAEVTQHISILHTKWNKESGTKNYRGQRDINPVICAAIGANGDSLQRAKSLIEAGANVLVIDVAHGHHKNVKQILRDLILLRQGEKMFVDFIAGNIATAEAAEDLQDWGADALRVGIGGGSVCETRIRTGIGVPQLTTVDSITSVATVPVISDGGIRYPGDIAKALAAGANSVMVGSLLAGTDEAPGAVFVAGKWPNNKNFKMYRGSASASIKMQKNGGAHHVEGASKMVEAKGPVSGIINDIMDGVTSSMSYLGVSEVEQMWQVAQFVKITNAGLTEAHPHLL